MLSFLMAYNCPHTLNIQKLHIVTNEFAKYGHAIIARTHPNYHS